MTSELEISRETDILGPGSQWSLMKSAWDKLERVDAMLLNGDSGAIGAYLEQMGRAWIAVVESPRQPDTRMTRYHGLWGRSPLGRSPAEASTGHFDDGRQVGIASVPPARLGAVVTFASSVSAAALLIGRNSSDRSCVTLDALMRAFDVSSQKFDWGTLLGEALAIRVTLGRVLRDEFGLETQLFDRPEPDRVQGSWR